MENIEIEEKGDSPKPQLCKISELFQYLTGTDRVLLVIGTITGIIGGLGFPAFVFFFGRLTDSFNPEKGGEDTLSKSITFTKMF